jgi:hypothetical protein
MTTRSDNGALVEILGDVNSFPMIASDILYTKSAVGLVDASGHARPLTSADKFAGFCRKKADNSAGIAAALNVDVVKKGTQRLSISGAVITDVGNPVYATDDDTYVFSPVGAVFIGIMTRFVSSGVGEVTFDAFHGIDPYGGRVWEVFSADATLTILDTAKGLWVDTDAKTVLMLTYAAGTALDVIVMNGGAFGTIAVQVDVDGGDVMSGPDDTGAAGGITTNTKATARRGDYIKIHSGGDDGYIISEKKGIWTIA